MKEQIKAIVSGFVTGIQQVVANPWKSLLLTVMILIVLDLFKAPNEAKTIPAIISYIDALARKINFNLIAFVAVILALRR